MDPIELVNKIDPDETVATKSYSPRLWAKGVRS